MVRGLTGFGFSAMAVSALALWMTPTPVVPAVLLPEVLASVWMLPAVWRDVHWPWMAWLIAGNALGIPLGVLWLANGDPNAVKAAISALVLLFAWALARQGRPPWGDGSATRLATGVVSGLCNGLAAIGGLVTVVMLLSTAVAVAATRATMIALSVVIDVYAVGIAATQSMVGVAAGSRWYACIDAARLRVLVVRVLMLLAGLVLAGALGRAFV